MLERPSISIFKQMSAVNPTNFAVLKPMVQSLNLGSPQSLRVDYIEDVGEFILLHYAPYDKVNRLVEKCKPAWLKKLLHKLLPDKPSFRVAGTLIPFEMLSQYVEAYMRQRGCLFNVMYLAKSSAFTYTVSFLDEKDRPVYRAFSYDSSGSYAEAYIKALRQCWSIVRPIENIEPEKEAAEKETVDEQDK